MMLKNFLFYAFSNFINTWEAEAGPGEVFRVFGIVSLALLALCIPMCEFSLTPFTCLAAEVTGTDVFGKLNRKLMYNVYARSPILRSLG